MPEFIENRPMPCSICGNYVQGTESSYTVKSGVMHECRWICGRCGNLVRVDEKLEEHSEN